MFVSRSFHFSQFVKKKWYLFFKFYSLIHKRTFFKKQQQNMTTATKDGYDDKQKMKSTFSRTKLSWLSNVARFCLELFEKKFPTTKWASTSHKIYIEAHHTQPTEKTTTATIQSWIQQQQKQWNFISKYVVSDDEEETWRSKLN